MPFRSSKMKISNDLLFWQKIVEYLPTIKSEFLKTFLSHSLRLFPKIKSGLNKKCSTQKKWLDKSKKVNILPLS